MQSPNVIRNWQIDQLRKNIKIIAHFISGVTYEDATTYRDGGEGWTVLEVMCHLRDFEQVFIERACHIVEQRPGDLPFPNPDQLAAERKYNEQSFIDAFGAWTDQREAQLRYFEDRREEEWSHTANHPRRGKMTLTDHLMLTVWHDNNHLEQMVKILMEKKP